MLSLIWRASKCSAQELRELPLRAAVALGAGGFGQPARPMQLLKAYGIVLPIGLLVWWAMPQITLVATPSIDAWIIYKAPDQIGSGDLVSFTLSDPIAGPRPISVTKYALCLPGERIDLIEKPSAIGDTFDGWYFCNFRLLGISKPRTRDGRPLTHWHPSSKIIPAGMIFVGSSSPDGFDSRYYGPVEVGRLTRMEKLL
ncbi:type IV secretory pathway protease TraF [Novosphingobium sp. 1748]|uniref:S26 family signal peptidase n=1 Tax=Novosphingobium sp. 1748 TaxID=2817760 RepID=UPI00285BC216|nr:S26 family signal peptidase [Novosphingobium sp. 1748]MDR6709279.1 type IV secretory pathway protease TraF [Novosphingobium sp. 1748]